MSTPAQKGSTSQEIQEHHGGNSTNFWVIRQSKENRLSHVEGGHNNPVGQPLSIILLVITQYSLDALIDGQESEKIAHDFYTKDDEHQQEGSSCQAQDDEGWTLLGLLRELLDDACKEGIKNNNKFNEADQPTRQYTNSTARQLTSLSIVDFQLLQEIFQIELSHG